MLQTCRLWAADTAGLEHRIGSRSKIVTGDRPALRGTVIERRDDNLDAARKKQVRVGRARYFAILLSLVEEIRERIDGVNRLCDSLGPSRERINR